MAIKDKMFEEEEIRKKICREKEEKDALENFKTFKYSEGQSLILDNPEEESSWKIDHIHRKLLNSKERENLENEFTKDLLLASEKRENYRRIPNLRSF